MKKWILNCKRCQLCETANTIGLAGHIGSNPVLAIFLDFPNWEEDKRHKFGYSRGTKLITWMLDRMSVGLDNVAIQFTLRCHKQDKQLSSKASRLAAIEGCSIHRFALLQKIKPKAIVAMGKISCEAFLDGAQHGDKEGTSWKPAEKQVTPRIWVSYAPGYALQSPAESPGIYRVLWRAAEQAGLTPKTNLNIPVFDYDN